MYLKYNFNGEQYEFDLTYKQVREAVAEIYCRDYDKSANKDTIKDFIYRFDLEYDVFNACEDDLHDYFRDEARQKYHNDCADDEYWKNTDIHGGV
jgi:hypothetical protein